MKQDKKQKALKVQALLKALKGDLSELENINDFKLLPPLVVRKQAGNDYLDYYTGLPASPQPGQPLIIIHD